MPRVDALVVSCEHASNRVPAAYRNLFAGRSRLLKSHRGWDPGALELSRRIARRHRAPLVAAAATRLLVECNRSLTHPLLFSEMVRHLDDDAREAIIARYYTPHRARVESAVRRRARAGARVLHVSVHSFAPVLRGVVRCADVGILYDPGRRAEGEIARAWRAAIRRTDPTLRVRLNYPYRGWADGLTTTLRTRFPAARYAGIELEVSQRFARRPTGRWRRVQDALVDSLSAIMV